MKAYVQNAVSMARIWRLPRDRRRMAVWFPNFLLPTIVRYPCSVGPRQRQTLLDSALHRYRIGLIVHVRMDNQNITELNPWDDYVW
jgi:hypothetical protein